MKVAAIVIAAMLMYGVSPVHAFSGGNEEYQFSAQAPKELRDFAFWLGEWEFTHKYKKSDGSWGESTGSNKISVTFGGWGILEDFTTGVAEKPFNGGSITIYDPKSNKLSQSWADNNGFVLTFVGGMEGDMMVLYSPEIKQNGKKYRTRLVWKNIQKEKMDWSYERTDDDGRTWRSLWDIAYLRVK